MADTVTTRSTLRERVLAAARATRPQLEFILFEILGFSPEFPILDTLEGIGILGTEDLFVARFEKIDKLCYVEKEDGKDVKTPVPSYLISRLKLFITYRAHLHKKTGTLLDTWNEDTVNKEDFDDYRVSYESARRLHAVYAHEDFDAILREEERRSQSQSGEPRASQGFPTGAPPPAGNDGYHDRDVPFVPRGNPLLLAWHKIKRVRADYPQLTADRGWDEWNRNLIGLAVHDEVYDVIDLSFTPTAGHPEELFQYQQRFMYTVFNQTLKTDKAKTILRLHAATRDARAIYRDLHAHYASSTAAQIQKRAVYAEITSMRITDWSHSQNKFLLAWRDKVRLYTELNHGVDIHETDKIHILYQAVVGAPNLAAVRTYADSLVTAGLPSHTFEQVFDLLESTAQQYDSTFNKSTNSRGTRRHALVHDVSSPTYDDDDQPYTYAYDDDFSVLDRPIYEISRASRPPRPVSHTTTPARPSPVASGPNTTRTRLSDDQWADLESKARRIWRSLPADAKAVILRYSTSPSPSPDVRVNLIATYPGDPDTMEHLLDRAGSYNAADIDNVEDPHSIATVAAALLRTGDPRKTLSSRFASAAPSSGTAPSEQLSSPDATASFQAHNTNVLYRVTRSTSVATDRNMVDRGANGGVAGSDMRVLHHHPFRHVDVEGYDQHCTTNIPLVTCANVVQTHRGEVLAVYHNYAYTGRGRTIHSVPQLEAFQQTVDDRSIKAGGMQRLTTIDGYILPIDIVHGLPYLKTRPCSDHDVENLPHVIMTSDCDWDPSILDHTHILDDFAQSLDFGPLPDHRFDERGDYRHRHVVTQHVLNHACGLLDGSSPSPLSVTDILHIDVDRHHVTTSSPDFDSLRPHFLWQSTDTIRRTFDATTQMARIPMSTVLRKWFKSPNPALNVHRRNEDVATDTVYSDTPAVCSGVTIAQFYVGCSTLVCDAYGIHTEKQFPDTLEDNIRHRGAPNRLRSDHAAVEISSRVKDLLRALHISDWQSEPYMQHQNFAERRWQDVKRITNTVLDRSGSPDDTWLLALQYVCHVLNHTATPSLRHRVPLELLLGSTVDISALLRFVWYEPVYFRVDDSDFPSDSRENYGFFVGFAENVGHALTYKILTRDTRRVIHRSAVRSALDPKSPNLRLNIFDGEDARELIRSRSKKQDQDCEHTDGETSDNNDGEIPGNVNGEPTDPQPQDDTDGERITPSYTHDLSSLRPHELVGRSILIDQEDGSKLRAKILRQLNDSNDPTIKDSAQQFLVSLGKEKHEELLSYQQILDYINRDMEDDRLWKFKSITAHQGPLSQGHPDYKGSTYNVQVEWENGEVTYEPLHLIAADDPVTCAIYAKDHNLLQTPGWKRFNSIARRHKKLIRMTNQAKLRSFRTTPKYMYGVEIPKDYRDALRLDKINGNTLWQDCTALEMAQLFEYKTFRDIGNGAPIPKGYKKIRVHLVFAVKHDGRHKARLVADGHLTDIPVDSVYSGVVSLKGLRAMIFLAELNGLQLWSTDVGNAYLEARTQERVCIVAGPEFTELEGHTLIIVKALYGLRSSGLRWHEKFADCLDDLGFFPCKAEPDIWIKASDDRYEYVGVYVDDLAIAMKDPTGFIYALEHKYKFNLKGTGELSFHLGCDFVRDIDGILGMCPIKFIERLVENYTRMFNEKPKTNVMSPLEKGDHPELDDSPYLDSEGITQFQSIIGGTQWAVTLGRFDIMTAVMTMSSFRSAPRTGHLERAKRIIRYLARFKHGVIKFRIGTPDYSDLPNHNTGWGKTIYGNVSEIIPDDAPPPRGRMVTLTRYVDANLYHDWLTGRSVTGIVTLANQTPLDWHSKKQPTVETATYGSEFIATRRAVELATEDRNLFRYLGAPVAQKDYMFGDNESVVNSSSRIDSKLHKRHNALSYHKVREAIASGYVAYYHVASKYNLADILTKHWGYNDVWMLLQTILFWKSGDTADIPDTNADSDKKRCAKDKDRIQRDAARQQDTTQTGQDTAHG